MHNKAINFCVRGILLMIGIGLYVRMIANARSTMVGIGLILLVATMMISMESIKKKKDYIFEINSTEEKIKHMSEKEFKQYIAGLYKRLGYYVEFPNKKLAKMVDFIIRSKTTTIALKCEVNQEDGLDSIKELSDSMKEYRIKQGIFICNTNYTQEMKKYAEQNKIELIGNEELVKLVEKVVRRNVKSKQKLDTQEV
ncbi:MAG: restriction endonuclease [Cellulosilyticaceae bacterium]